MNDNIHPVFQNILNNIEQGITSGLAKSAENSVSGEFSELEDKIAETIESLTERVTNGEIDLPVSCMWKLKQAGDSIREAIREYNDYRERMKGGQNG